MKYFFSVIFFFLLSHSIMSQEQFSVYFETNKHQLKKAENEKLKQWMKLNSEVKIVAINGYTDEDGTMGFNDTLAQKRVTQIFDIVSEKIRIRDDFKSRSFGELHQHSKIKAENRKVTIYYIEAKDFPREDEILGIKKEIQVEKPKPKRQYPDIIELQNPNGTKSLIELDTEFMKKVDESKPGEKLKLENLNFQLNTFAIMNESRGKLYELLIVMQQNSELSLAIQGHLCCMPYDRVDLSTKRAKAVYQFLIMNGVDKSRLSYEGFGSDKPIYTLPEKNEEERAANRRVEVEIVKN